jgi:Carboxypeptidase regulatory-like domain
MTNGEPTRVRSTALVRASTALSILFTLGCGGPSTPTVAPTPTPSPSPTPGVVRIVGSVQDTAFRPLADVNVEMTDGPQAGASTTTNSSGQFAFSGTFAPGTITFRISKAGYADVMQTLKVPSTGPNAGVPFTILQSLAPPVNIAGDYTLTFVADSMCTQIPEELRIRTYEALITAVVSNPSIPPNTFFTAKVSGDFLIDPFNQSPTSPVFSIGVAGHDLGFNVDFDGPLLVEQLDSKTFLSIDGIAYAAVDTSAPSAITAPLDGYFDYCVLKSEGTYRSCSITSQTVTHSGCASRNHRLILTRR